MCSWVRNNYFLLFTLVINFPLSSALDSLGYGDFRKDCEEVLSECKDVAAKRRRQSMRLENLGIPEEELLRQQQELFARARQEAAEQVRREMFLH